VCYRSIEDTIKSMSVVLPLINELHSNAMRDRHWKNLAKVCAVKTIDAHDPKFTFEDAIKLKLHEHVEDVEEIVETASKELKIERKLRDIENIWRDMNLEYVQHNDTDMFLVKLSEEVIESLESHQLELQTMIGMGKFVDFFRDRVLQWQGTMGSVEKIYKLAHANHRLQLQLVALETFDDFFAELDQEHISVVVLHVLEVHVTPDVFDVTQLALDLELLRGGLHNFFDIFNVLVKLEFNRIFKSKLWIVCVDGFDSAHFSKILPVAITHGVAMQLVYQR